MESPSNHHQEWTSSSFVSSLVVTKSQTARFKSISQHTTLPSIIIVWLAQHMKHKKSEYKQISNEKRQWRVTRSCVGLGRAREGKNEKRENSQASRWAPLKSIARDCINIHNNDGDCLAALSRRRIFASKAWRALTEGFGMEDLFHSCGNKLCISFRSVCGGLFSFVFPQ